jgi:hypothetical protein
MLRQRLIEIELVWLYTLALALVLLWQAMAR